MYDVLIIGGGAAGYGTALTLGSVENKFQWAKDKKYLMIDDGQSDILNASFFNLTGVQYGIGGDKLLDTMKQQLKNFKSCTTVCDTVIKIIKTTNSYKVISTNNTYYATIVVLATGMHRFDIECDLVDVLPHNNIMKPNKICLKNQNNQISKNLYVAGLASGAKTMFAIANGEGTKVACDIFQLWTGKNSVAHDSLKDKIDS